MTRIPLPGPWPIAPGDVVLLALPDGSDRYARVLRVRRTVRTRRVVALTTADGRRWRVVEGARLAWCAEGRRHVGAVGVVVEVAVDG